MKTTLLPIVVALGLAFAVSAAEPTAPTAPPPAHGDAHGKMNHGTMDHGNMDHGKMDWKEKSPAERQQRIDEMFSAIDTNKDGSLSKAEFSQHHLQRMDERHERMMMRHDKDHDGMMDDDRSAEHHQRAMEMFTRFDANKDGSLSKAELPAQNHLLQHFDMVDANKDGRVTQAELAAHHGR